jgi:hypothetical protein
MGQDALTTRVGELNTALKQKAEEMAKASPEQAAKIRAEMEQLTFLLEQCNKALEKLYQADKESKGPQ